MGKKSNLKKKKREGIKKENLEKANDKIQEKSEESPMQEREDKSVTRIVILETDGNSVRISKNTTSGNLELVSMLQMLLSNLTSPK